MSDNRSVELVFRLRTEGREQTEAAVRSLGAVREEARKGAAELRGLDEANAKVSQSFSNGARAAKAFDVGIGSLLDSARKASAEMRSLAQSNDQNIKSLERQAALMGAKGSTRIDLQRQFALADYGKTAADIARINAAFDQMAAANDRANQSMTASVVVGNLLSEGISRATDFAKRYTIEAAQYAARTQTMTVVMDQLSKTNNLSGEAVRAQAQEVRKLGIVNQEAIGTVSRMIFAQLDLKKATDLARLAQNAAVIGGQNSSEALNGIVHGVVTRQPEVLRTYGIIVDFERAFTAESRKLGRELTSVEKQHLALNLVLEQGSKITGAYEASMLTAGKQMSSLTRYTLEAEEAIGNAFVPALGRGIRMLTEMAHWATENASSVATLATSITAASVAALAFRYVPGPLPLKLGAAAAAGGAAAYLTSGDPVEEVRANAATAFGGLDRERRRLNERLAIGNLPKSEAESIRGRFTAIDSGERTVIEASAEAIAQAIITKVGKDNRGEIARKSDVERAIAELAGQSGRIEIGAGRSIRTTDVFTALQRIESPDRSGPVFNQEAYDKSVKAGQEEQAQQKALEESKRRQKSIVDAEFSAVKELRQLEAQRLEGYARLTAEHAAEVAEAREHGRLSEKLKATLDQQLIVRQQLLEKSLASSLKSAPQVFRRGIPVNVLNEGFSIQPTESVNVDDENLGANALRRINQIRSDALQRLGAFQIQLAQLQAGPDQQVQAIEKVMRLRLDAAAQQFAIDKDHARFSLEQHEAERARIIDLLQLRRRGEEQYRDAAGRVYDALRQRGDGGLGALLRGQFDIQGRAVFQNVSGKVLQTAGTRLSELGASSGLPSWLLRGTIADPQQAQIANSLAVDRNTAATDRLTQVLQSGGSSTTIGNSGVVGLAPGGVVPGFAGAAVSGTQSVVSAFRGSGSGGRLGEFGFGASTAYGGLFAGLGSGQIVRGDSGYVLTGNEKLGNVVGSAGIVAAGTMGVLSGIRQGGGRGALTALGSGLGVVSAIPGPQQPFIAAAALITGIVSSMLGDPKRIREEQIQRQLAESRYEAPAGTNRNQDLVGNDVDYTRRGQARVIVQINAMDARSMLDRKHDIAAAVAGALNEGGTDLSDSIRSTVDRG